MQLVPVRSQDEIEVSLLAMKIAWRLNELAALRAELAPLESAFSAFERMVSRHSAAVTRERDRLRTLCSELESFTTRIHARLTADPDGVLDAVFSPAELRRIGELFGVDIPDDWFGDARTRRASTDWDWADAESPEESAHTPTLSDDARAELRNIYRELARMYHPDLAAHAGDLAFRQEMMHRINDAWHARDIDALRAIQRDISSSPTASFALVWHRGELARVEAECQSVRARIAALRGSKTRALWHDAALAQASIARHIERLRAEIDALTARHEQAVSEFHTALQWYASARAR